MTELEIAQEQVEIAQAMLRLRHLQRVYDLQYGKGSYLRSLSQLSREADRTEFLPEVIGD